MSNNAVLDIDWTERTDAEIVLAAMCAGLVRWVPFRPGFLAGELVMQGIRYCVDLHPATGVPMIDEDLRARIIAVVSVFYAD